MGKVFTVNVQNDEVRNNADWISCYSVIIDMKRETDTDMIISAAEHTEYLLNIQQVVFYRIE